MERYSKRIICGRLEKYFDWRRGLSESQFGFRKAKSTIDAIEKVADIANEAIDGKR